MKVELAAYNPQWPGLFEQEKQLILPGFPLQDVMIEHIGSTSVPGLKAKSVIDMMIGIPALPGDITAIEAHLKRSGYEYIEKYNALMPDRRFFIKEQDGKRTHHIHMTAMDSEFWKRHLFFRDQLRNKPELNEQYEALKTALAQNDWESTNAYADAKSEFIQSVDRERAKLH